MEFNDSVVRAELWRMADAGVDVTILQALLFPPHGRRWVFTFEGKEHRHGDLKVPEMVTLEKITGLRYGAHRPMLEMVHRRAYMVAFLAADRSDAEVKALIDAMTVDDSDHAWAWEDYPSAPAGPPDNADYTVGSSAWALPDETE